MIIDLDVLLGARDGPAILEGYGPIPASMARELAADGDVAAGAPRTRRRLAARLRADPLPTLREAP